MRSYPPKYPPETNDYAFDFADVLVAGETITEKAITVVRGDVTVANEQIAGGKVTFWLSGGTAPAGNSPSQLHVSSVFGTVNLLQIEITTSAGRTYVATPAITVIPEN